MFIKDLEYNGDSSVAAYFIDLNIKRRSKAKYLANRLQKSSILSREDWLKIYEMIESKDPDNITMAEELMKNIRRSYNKKFKW